MAAVINYVQSDFNYELGIGPVLPAAVVTTGTIFTATVAATAWNSGKILLQVDQPDLATGWQTIGTLTANGTLTDTPSLRLSGSPPAKDTTTQYRFILGVNADLGDLTFNQALNHPAGVTIAVTQ